MLQTPTRIVHKKSIVFGGKFHHLGIWLWIMQLNWICPGPNVRCVVHCNIVFVKKIYNLFFFWFWNNFHNQNWMSHIQGLLILCFHLSFDFMVTHDLLCCNVLWQKSRWFSQMTFGPSEPSVAEAGNRCHLVKTVEFILHSTFNATPIQTTPWISFRWHWRFQI